MRSSAHAFALLAALAASCTGGQTGDEGVARSSGRKSHTMSSSDGGKGVKGGGGNPVGCTTDLECTSRLDSIASMLAAPIHNPRTLLGSECESASSGCGDGTFCACVYQQDTGPDGFPSSVLGLGFNAPCDLYSRDGSCLLPADQFAGCDIGDATSCDAACARALEAWARDDARTLDVKARHASCVLAEHECRVVLDVDGKCHPTGGVEGAVYDCALDDHEILTRAFPDVGDAGPRDEFGALPQCTGGQGCEQGRPYGGPRCEIGACSRTIGDSIRLCLPSGALLDAGPIPER